MKTELISTLTATFLKMYHLCEDKEMVYNRSIEQKVRYYSNRIKKLIIEKEKEIEILRDAMNILYLREFEYVAGGTSDWIKQEKKEIDALEEFVGILKRFDFLEVQEEESGACGLRSDIPI